MPVVYLLSGVLFSLACVPLLIAGSAYNTCHSRCKCTPDDDGGTMVTCISPAFTSVEFLLAHMPPSLSSLEVENQRLSTLSLGKSGLRRFSKLKKISLRRCQIETLDESFFKGARQLKEVSLESNNLRVLNQNMFADLGYLEVLQLSNNTFVSVANGTFARCVNLRVLKMDQNRLTGENPHWLSPTVLKGLVDLQELSLQENHFTYNIQLNISDSKKLRKLRLNGNHFAVFGGGIISGSESLREIYLSSVELGRILEDAFTDLPNLQLVDLSENSLEDLPSQLFSNNKHLITFNLGGNKLKGLPSGIFCTSLKVLQKFDLSRNYIKSLNDICLRETVELKQLNVSGGYFKELGEFSLARLQNLKILDCSNGIISSIHGNPFRNVTKLSWVDLAGNGIKTLPTKMFASLSTMHQLDLSRNDIEITITSEHVEGLKTLKMLNLSWNKVTSIDLDVFSTLQQLEYLNLNGNELTGLHLRGSLPSLTSLLLSNNLLTNASRDLMPSAKRLRWIDLSYNKIQQVYSDVFAITRDLQFIYLQDNQISEIDIGIFTSMKKLHYLNLHNNKACLTRNEFATLHRIPSFVASSVEPNCSANQPQNSPTEIETNNQYRSLQGTILIWQIIAGVAGTFLTISLIVTCCLCVKLNRKPPKQCDPTVKFVADDQKLKQNELPESDRSYQPTKASPVTHGHQFESPYYEAMPNDYDTPRYHEPTRPVSGSYAYDYASTQSEQGTVYFEAV